MKKIDIIKLYKSGIIEVSAHTLSAAHAYKVFKMKREVEKTHKAIEEDQEKIMEEVGLTKEFREKIADIFGKEANLVTDADKAAVKEYQALQRKVEKLFEEQSKEDVSLDIKTIPYNEWRKLQDENKAKKINDKEVDILAGIAEIILAEVFWVEPTEEETKEEKKENN